jgi:hypothetical protein
MFKSIWFGLLVWPAVCSGLTSSTTENLQRGQKDMKAQVDVGGDVLCQAYVPDVASVFIAIGRGKPAARLLLVCLLHMPYYP